MRLTIRRLLKRHNLRVRCSYVRKSVEDGFQKTVGGRFKKTREQFAGRGITLREVVLTGRPVGALNDSSNGADDGLDRGLVEMEWHGQHVFWEFVS